MDDMRFLFDSGDILINYCTPACLGFVRWQWEKERYKPSLDVGNVNKFMSVELSSS